MPDVIAEVRGRVVFITLNRARALNALSLAMIRDLTSTLQAWQDDPQVLAVAVRGMSREAWEAFFRTLLPPCRAGW